MSLITVLIFCAAVASLVLGGTVLLRQPKLLAHQSFAAGMALFSLEALVTGLTTLSSEPLRIVALQNLRLVFVSLVPGTWLVFSTVYARGNHEESLRRSWPVLALTFVLPLVASLVLNDLLFSKGEFQLTVNDWALKLGMAGVMLNIFFLVGVVLVLMNLERTFRASVGTVRWQIKFMVLGLGLLFVVRIYTSSQALLYSSITQSLQVINALTLFLACPLITVSLFRSKVFTIEIYPSRAVLQSSFTILLVAVYLLCVGWLANLVTALGGTSGFPIKAFLVLLALVALSLLLLSDRIRQRSHRFISRHFHRPLYDYRKLWTAFTERTTSILKPTNLCREVSTLISETFQALSVTVWLLDERKEKLNFAASTSLSEAAAMDLLGSPSEAAQLLQAIRSHPHPVDLDESQEGWAELLRRCNPDYFHKGGGRLAVPLVAGGELLGLMTLADRVNGLPFTVEDHDVLKCIGDQVAASLLNMQLSQSLLQAKEMEAFQTMSAFFVHDLKNTASTLSLMLQNLPVHFDDPAFREDALRAVGKSVNHLNHLVGRLTALRHKLDLARVEADLNQVVAGALAEVEGVSASGLVKNLQPVPRALMDPEQISKVIVNLVLNARDAVGADGQIEVETGQENGWLRVAVKDNGCGMTEEFIKTSLFRPFRTTKKRGIGIGLYHSKVLIEAHRGKIEVESTPGKGTTFRVLLPLQTQAT